MNGSFATSGVPGTRFVDVRWVAETGSTNRDVLGAAAEGAPEGLVLVADHQTAGRGRLNRSWIAPAGASLLVSALLRPSLDPDDLFLLTLACGLAAREAVDEVAGVRPGLKWPNDLVVAEGPLIDRKLGGILAESQVISGRVAAVVVGMGLNLDWPTDLPEELSATAASVNHLTGSPVERESVLIRWLVHFDHLLSKINDPVGRRQFLDQIRAASSTLGRQVRVEGLGEMIEGRAIDIDDRGHLLVDHDGQIIDVAVGDVIHARLAD